MARTPNTDSNGQQWSDVTKMEVWEKGRIIPGYPPDIWRHDECRSLMRFSEFGKRESKYGWEIDHINPVSNGGTDDPGNLQPLHWINNVEKADKVYWQPQNV